MPVLNTAPGARLGTVPVRALYRGSQKIAGLRNLANNPSFEFTTGDVEVLRNYVTHPRATAWTLSAGQIGFQNTRWGSEGVYALLTGITGGPCGITTAAQYTVTTARAGHGFHLAGNVEDPTPSATSTYPMAAGTTQTFSVYFRKTGASVNMLLRVRPADASVWLAGATQVSLASTSDWQRISITFTAPAGTTRVAISMNANTMDAVGDVYQATGFAITATPALMPYFDGSYSSDSDLTAAWTGTANASVSTLRGVWDGAHTRNGGAIPVASAQWASSGAKSLRVIPSVSSGDSGVWVAGSYNIDSLSGYGVTFEAGKTYTVLAKCRLDGPTTQPNPTYLDKRSIQVIYNTVAGWTGATSRYSNQAPNAAGETICVVTFTLPANAVGCGVRLRNGGSIGQGDVWWDDLMIVEGTYTGPYRDGRSPGWAWEGTPDASPSYGLN